jgi:hypothetical protein
LGCPEGVVPAFCIKRHDTKPALKISVEDCDGVVDLTDESLVLEVNMWAKAKLKKTITAEENYLSFADGIGFNQVMQNDIIIIERTRSPEHMLVTGFDETNKLINVQRAYNGTQAQACNKGDSLRIFRLMDAPAQIESVFEDILQADGTSLSDQLVSTFMVYNWDANSTCLPGCYWLEFKLMKINNSTPLINSSSISFTPSSLTPEDFGCFSGLGVEWVRRFPSSSEGFLISIIDSPTQEL